MEPSFKHGYNRDNTTLFKNKESSPSPCSGFIQKVDMCFLELGMGVEPTCNSSAGCRLNRSATPAHGNF